MHPVRPSDGLCIAKLDDVFVVHVRDNLSYDEMDDLAGGTNPRQVVHMTEDYIRKIWKFIEGRWYAEFLPLKSLLQHGLENVL